MELLGSALSKSDALLLIAEGYVTSYNFGKLGFKITATGLYVAVFSVVSALIYIHVGLPWSSLDTVAQKIFATTAILNVLTMGIITSIPVYKAWTSSKSKFLSYAYWIAWSAATGNSLILIYGKEYLIQAANWL